MKTDIELKNLMKVPENCRNLNDYLTRFDYPLSLMQTEEGLTDSVYGLLKIQESQGMIYSEIRFAPQLHRSGGLTQWEAVAAAVRGLEAYRNTSGDDGMKANLILCCMRGEDNPDANMETVSMAGEYLGKGVCALDLAGAEGMFPTKDFENIFKLAKKKKRFPLPFMQGKLTDRKVYGRRWNLAHSVSAMVSAVWKTENLSVILQRHRSSGTVSDKQYEYKNIQSYFGISPETAYGCRDPGDDQYG